MDKSHVRFSHEQINLVQFTSFKAFMRSIKHRKKYFLALEQMEKKTGSFRRVKP